MEGLLADEEKGRSVGTKETTRVQRLERPAMVGDY